MMNEKEALQFVVDHLRYYQSQEIDPEPHEVSTNFETQTTVLECTGCAAKGQRRWQNGWRTEFVHDEKCRWIEFVNKLNELGIECHLRKVK
jgi:hypothetical protein